MGILKKRGPVQLTQLLEPAEKEKRAHVSSSEDDSLFEHLRILRRSLADAQNVPAYIIFSDAALRQMAWQKPITLEEFSLISGVGEKKQKAFGAVFTKEIQAFLENA
jgi:ATP-dependent DNA helicase RecQ